MPSKTDLASEDKTLIEREIANGLRLYFSPVARDPLPDEFQALLERLEETEGRGGEAQASRRRG